MSSTNKTSTLTLNQWVATDPVLMEDFNSDNQKLDSAINALQRNALKIAAGSYVGTGTHGASNRNCLTFSFAPKLLLVMPAAYPHPLGFPWLRGVTEAITEPLNTIDDNHVHIEWSGNTVYWYANSYAYSQYNDSNTTYRYLALG